MTHCNLAFYVVFSCFVSVFASSHLGMVKYGSNSCQIHQFQSTWIHFECATNYTMNRKYCLRWHTNCRESERVSEKNPHIFLLYGSAHSWIMNINFSDLWTLNSCVMCCVLRMYCVLALPIDVWVCCLCVSNSQFDNYSTGLWIWRVFFSFLLVISHLLVCVLLLLLLFKYNTSQMEVFCSKTKQIARAKKNNNDFLPTTITTTSIHTHWLRHETCLHWNRTRCGNNNRGKTYASHTHDKGFRSRDYTGQQKISRKNICWNVILVTWIRFDGMFYASPTKKSLSFSTGYCYCW